MKPSELNERIGAGDESARSEKDVLINRVGQKIARIRESKKLPDFQAWRMGLYDLPEDDREAAVDSKLSELGL